MDNPNDQQAKNDLKSILKTVRSEADKQVQRGGSTGLAFETNAGPAEYGTSLIVSRPCAAVGSASALASTRIGAKNLLREACGHPHRVCIGDLGGESNELFANFRRVDRELGIEASPNRGTVADLFRFAYSGGGRTISSRRLGHP
ncbi:hypothetical protein [Nocardia sp. NPDC003726]